MGWGCAGGLDQITWGGAGSRNEGEAVKDQGGHVTLAGQSEFFPELLKTKAERSLLYLVGFSQKQTLSR